MFSSSGILRFDPKKGTKHYIANWCLLECDEGIAEHYSWHLKKYGLESNSKSLWGTHISIVKGEVIPDPSTWGSLEGMEVEFFTTM